jgi:predicted amidohydrolase YtcJ
MIDLNGQTLIPGFIDAHSHFSFAMKLVRQADLSPPPVGHINSISAIVNTLDKLKNENNIAPGEWIVGWGYDQDQLEEIRHPNRYDLDVQFPDHPVFLLHTSAHMAVLNSKGLELAGISSETSDPEGGVIVRMPNSREPSGLVQESVLYPVSQLAISNTADELILLLEETQQFYASQGITTAQDGLMDMATFKFLDSLAMLDKLFLDIEALARFQEAKEWVTDYKDRFGRSESRLRLTGLKIVTDGSPQGKTAFFSKPYLTEVPGCAHACTGVPIVNSDQLSGLLKLTYSNGIQTYVHCNGDASIDMLLDAHRQTKGLWKAESRNSRTVVIHSQFVRPDQLDAYAEFGFVPSFFTNHAFYWGDVHLENLGEERANFLSPLHTANKKGIIVTNHTDYIVTPLNQLFMVWTAVNRTSRSGKVIGPSERISPHEALKAITINAAYQHHTEKMKGSISQGKLADLVILDRNPLEVPKDEIKDIKVVETIKEGKSIYTIMK